MDISKRERILTIINPINLGYRLLTQWIYKCSISHESWP